jgi:phospholipase/lecithinase/hemolysin
MTTVFWKHGISGQFDTAADWSTNTVPTANDDVIIGIPGTYAVTVSTNHVIRSLRTVNTATLAVTGGRFAIAQGTGTGFNAGTISIGNGAALQIGTILRSNVTFRNSGKITLNSTGHSTELIIGANVTLSGHGAITLSADGHSGIVAARPLNPFLLTASTLVNVDNTISGAGVIGSPTLALVNRATIDGNSATAALTVNTGVHGIGNSGRMEGATAQGLVIVSNVANTGQLEASGQNARLVIDGTVTNSGPHAGVIASGNGAHVDFDSAAMIGGTLNIGSGGIAQTDARSGISVISGASVFGSGTLQANSDTALNVINGSVASSLALMANGHGSVLSIDGTVGPAVATISGGEIEFKGASAANVTFAPGQVGILKLGASFTGTIAGFAGSEPVSFTNFFAFGDSTLDSGALQFLSPDLPSPPNPGITDRLQNALAAGGNNSPVGVGLMNSQLLAADFGLAADTAYTTGGAVGGGGTNYAIAGALDAADTGNASTGDPGNGGVSNINQAGKPNPDPHLLSTVAQIESYLNSIGGAADPSALYLISSGGNDFTYAHNFLGGAAQAYMFAQAQTLATEIAKLFHDGAEHIIVDTTQNNNGNQLESDYSGQLFADLDAAGVPYIKSDVHTMVQDVIANPTAYGFTAATAGEGVAGPQTESALIEPDTVDNLKGWGLWGADTTTPDSSQPVNHQYAYLSTPDAEQTHFFSDDQHLSAAGQQIEANLDHNLLTDDAIDLANLPYTLGNTTVGFSGTASGGTLTVTSGAQSANIALLGNYLAATFMTAGDGLGGTLVLDQTNSSPQLLLAAAHH